MGVLAATSLPSASLRRGLERTDELVDDPAAAVSASKNDLTGGKPTTCAPSTGANDVAELTYDKRGDSRLGAGFASCERRTGRVR